jgi:hypothetical protein
MNDWGLGTSKSPELCGAWIRWANRGGPTLAEEDARTDDRDEEVAEPFSSFLEVLDADVRTPTGQACQARSVRNLASTNHR